MDEQSFLISALGRVSDALALAKVPFALAGGLAFSALVEPRATVDIDLLIFAEDMDRAKLMTALSPHFDSLLPHEEPMVFRTIVVWRVVAVQGNRELVLDFLLGEDDFCREALQRKTTAAFHGHALSLVTIEDLYLLKLCADRPQDRLDLATMERLKGPSLDRAYIASWRKQWGL